MKSLAVAVLGDQNVLGLYMEGFYGGYLFTANTQESIMHSQ